MNSQEEAEKLQKKLDALVPLIKAEQKLEKLKEAGHGGNKQKIKKIKAAKEELVAARQFYRSQDEDRQNVNIGTLDVHSNVFDDGGAE